MKLYAHRSNLFVPIALCALLAAACSSSDAPAVADTTPAGDDFPLSDPNALEEGAPGNDTLPEEGKADATYPATFFDLVKLQSPVRNQRSRGVCSIFSTVALMEHLYIAEGTIKTPDFSEQFLQWSVKKEVGAYTQTEGSNADRNIEAINRFGIPVETAWAYEPTKWNSSNDAACVGGETQPVTCYTNGEPPQAAMQAERYKLPKGRYINSADASIKAFMVSKKQGVVMGGKFFYQAWNHGASAIPVSGAYSRKGYVLYPNDKDKVESLKKPAGHSVLLVGWDDTLEVQRLDAEGKPMVDAQGVAVKEKGFYIFKNSWGADRFGIESPHGAGYGYISYKYVKEYGTVYGADLPVLKTTPEVCNDKIDNDLDGKIDCNDADCSSNSACTAPGNNYENNSATPIPDNNKTGIKSEINVADAGLIQAISVTVDITHPYRGDLTVKLVHESGAEVTLADREGSGDDNLKKTFAPTSFNGLEAKGKWNLVVIDNAKTDIGTLNKWSLQISRCTGATCGAGATAHFENLTPAAIPDNNQTGVFTNIEVTDTGKIKGMTVKVDVEHPAKGNLTIRLQKVLSPTEVVLLKADASSGAFTARSFTVSDFLSQDMKGTWRLTVVDGTAGDTGTLKNWAIDFLK